MTAPLPNSTSLSRSPTLSGAVLERSKILLAHQRQKISARTDKHLSMLIVAEWIGTMITALIVSPRSWSGAASTIHVHLVAAVLLGGAIAVPTFFVTQRRLGETSTRHIVAVAQMLMGALLVDVTGGRIETHFYIFGSLAFLAFYRDWRVIVTASMVVVVDHLARGLFLPQSIFGVAHASLWRPIEHAWWVVFEDFFLIQSCLHSQREMEGISARHAELEMKMDVESRFVAAQEANRLKSEFLANMSHEIRTPMTAIQGYTDLLLDPALTVNERQNHVQVIRRNSEHLLSVLNDILDLSKIEAGKMTVESTECSPARIAAEVASLMRSRAAEKKLGFSLEFETLIPSTIKSDPTRVRQVLLNLVGNAIKFTEKGHVRILVRCLGANSLTPLLDFSVEDTGIGLTEDQRARLFRPFEQADASTTRKYGGTGLGLAICRSLAELLGGGIDVVSAPGSGSAFTLRIATGPLLGVPFVENAHEALEGEPTLVQSAKMMMRLQGSILLAEDGADNQLLITTLLEKAGATVTVAQNGKIAVEKALAAQRAGAPFDVVLMDMQMPELDGYAATSRLRSEGYSGPIVALTAHAMAGDRAKCVAVGCDDYLTKPVDRFRLLTTVRAMVERAPNRAAAEPVRGAAEEPLVSEAADDDELGEALVVFTAALPSRATAISAAEASEDWARLKTLSHQLKGAAGSFGYPSITDACAEVEASVAAGVPADRTGLRAQVRKLTTLCNRATATRPGRKCA